tara:strand:- start:343 stop:936 length:594 start_codon:yes stop_codon:yes gene_type:complete
MSFRVEEKIILNFGNLHDFKYWLKTKNAKKIYPIRKIASIYFDNIYNDMFIHSEEGVVPRKKIRIRNYPNSENTTILLEKKISSVEGRFKTSNIISTKLFKNNISRGILDSIYGICLPKIIVNYDREYFLLNKSRITIDQNITYSSFRSKKKIHNEKNFVIEIKENQNLNKELKEILPYERRRFSKYCRAVNELNIY